VERPDDPSYRSAAARLLCRPLQRLVRRNLRVRSGRGMRAWPRRRGPMKQALYAEVLVNVRPVNALAGSDQTKVCSLHGRGFGQPPGPGQRYADHTPVGQVGGDPVLGHTDVLNARMVWLVQGGVSSIRIPSRLTPDRSS